MRGRFPDFLVIGPWKTGSTWLYSNLKMHYQVWMPPVKEVNYFTLRSKGELFGFHSSFLWREFHQFQQRFFCNSLKEIAWKLRFFFLPRTDNWYRMQFPSSSEKICGDATPGYAYYANVADVHRLVPNAKIIFCLRHPVERLWSFWNMRMHYGNRCSEDMIACSPELQFAEILSYKEVCVKTIDLYRRWAEYYSEDQIKVFFFDDLAEDSLVFYQSVLRALEVDSENITVNFKKNGSFSSKNEIHPRLRRLLTEYYYDDIVEINALFGSHAKKWLEDAQKLLRKTDVDTESKHTSDLLVHTMA